MASINISKLRRIAGAGSSDISLVGPTTVVAGTDNTYTITDYDDFSVYTVEVDQGTVSRTEDIITVGVPPTGVNIVTLTLGRNNNFRDFEIAVGASGIARPGITYPSQSASSVPNSFVIQGTAFASVPVGVTTHKESRFQVARDAGFTDLVLNTLVTTGNLTQTSVSGLVAGQQYYVRVKYIGVNTTESEYSSPVSFTVSTQSIAKPVVTSISGTVGIGSTPTFTASAFTPFPAGSDSHVSSSWVLRGTDDSIIWQSVNDSLNKTSITIPSGILSTSTNYSIEVQYNGGFSSSMFSDKLTFSTASSFVPSTPGAPFGGGYYAGANIVADGVEYALVVAPKSLGGDAPSYLAWKTTDTPTTGTNSINNGLSNTNAMIAAGASAHPAANFCKNLTIGGYTDWYLPSKDELEIIYRYLKPDTQTNNTNYGANTSSRPPTSNYTSINPAQTSVALFVQGGAEAMQAIYYWSSTQSSSEFAWRLDFNGGGIQSTTYKSGTYGVRGVRRVPV